MNRPNETWELDRLAEYVLTGLAKVAQRERKIRQLNRRTAVETHRIGHALSLAREKTKPTGRWTRWLTKHGIPTTTAWEAIKLFEAASEEDVAAMTISEAKARYGIYPEFMPDDESNSQTAAARQEGDAEQQVNILYRRLKGAIEIVNSLQWEREFIYSEEMNEILQFCRQLMQTINEQRKMVRKPKLENTQPISCSSSFPMKTVGIIDAELVGNRQHRFPNLAAMKLSAYHKKRGDVVSLLPRLPLRRRFRTNLHLLRVHRHRQDHSS